MKLLSWNVNGLRACLKKGFADVFAQQGADIFCIQETKMQPDQAEFTIEGYTQYWNSAVKKGYSGTAIFTKQPALRVSLGIGVPAHDTEGRVITLDMGDFFMVNVYTPNSQRGLARIDYRMVWEDAFRAFLLELDAQKPVIVCGDMNVARSEIDLKNPKTNVGNAGFSEQERAKMEELLQSGFVDTFRALYPDVTGAYTWWSYMFHARDTNAGWRIDYFLVSERLRPHIRDARILSDVLGSDHCPVALDIF
nr:exodeoxyribonuclease III [Maliibacterium massiliense]